MRITKKTSATGSVAKIVIVLAIAAAGQFPGGWRTAFAAEEQAVSGSDASDRLQELEGRISDTEAKFGPNGPQLIPLFISKSLLLGKGPASAQKSADRRAAVQRLLTLQEREFGVDSPEVLPALAILGQLLLRANQCQSAIPLLQRELSIKAATHASEDVVDGATFRSIGVCQKYLGNYREAELSYRRALAVFDGQSGADLQTASTLESLGLLYLDMNRFGEAVPAIERSMKIREAKLGPEHSDFAASLNSLGLAYGDLGQDERARELLSRALAIRERNFGIRSPEAAVTQNNLGTALIRLHRVREAAPLLERSLETRTQLFGDQNVDVANILNTLGLLYSQLGQYGKSLDAYSRSFAIWQKISGDRHPALLTSLSNVAMLQLDNGNKDDALSTLLQADALATAIGDRTIIGASVKLLIAQRRFEQGRLEEAVFMGKEAVNIVQSIRAGAGNLDSSLQNSLLTGNSVHYLWLSSWLIRLGRLSEAEQVLSMLKERERFEFTRDAGAGDMQSASMTSVEAGLDRQYRSLRAAGIAQVNELASLRRLDEQGVKLSPEQEARKAQLRRDQERWQADFDRFMASLQPSLSRDTRAAGELRRRIEANSSALTGYLRESNDKSALRHAALSFVVTDDSISVIVSTAEGATARQTPLKRTELYDRVGQLRQALQNPKVDPRPAAQALYKILIGPVEEELSTLAPQVLVLNLTDILRYLPFSALYDGQQYLVQRYALALYPSAGFRGVQTQAAADWHVAGLGLTRRRRSKTVNSRL